MDGFASIDTDGSGNIWGAGFTYSSNFPTLNPLQSTYGGGSAPDAVIVKFGSSGTLMFSTYYGAGDWDQATDIAIDGSGNVCVTGRAGAGFPVSNAVQPSYGGGYDAFILVLTGSGSLSSATFYGGQNEDYGLAITGDAAGNIFCVGETQGNFPLINAWQSQYGGGTDDGFLALRPFLWDRNWLRTIGLARILSLESI